MSFNVGDVYSTFSKWFALTPPLAAVGAYFVDAPFGRFALKEKSIFRVDGIKAWVLMEIVSPLTFVTTLLYAPLAKGSLPPPPLALSIRDPRSVLAALFLIHYANRAVISPARSPPRSKSHIGVVISAVFFNLVNGFLLGAYLSSPSAFAYLVSEPESPIAFSSPRFYVGIVAWVIGFVGNLVHDEILFNIRRDAMRKKAETKEKGEKDAQPHYGIPYGYLYRWISYPNYFTEWVEWAGYAFAAAPIPNFSLGLTALTTAAPPWLFFAANFFVMIPRALKGHQWYLSKFPEYPKERKAVVPYLI